MHAALQGFHIIPAATQTMSPSDMALRFPSLYPALPSSTFAAAPRHPFHPLAILPPHASLHALPQPSDLDSADLEDPDDLGERDQEHDLLAEWIASQPVLSPLVRRLANLENRWGSGIYYVFFFTLLTPIVGLVSWVRLSVSAFFLLLVFSDVFAVSVCLVVDHTCSLFGDMIACNPGPWSASVLSTTRYQPSGHRGESCGCRQCHQCLVLCVGSTWRRRNRSCNRYHRQDYIVSAVSVRNGQSWDARIRWFA